MEKFTLYWKTGQREIVEGRNIGEAMTLAGYGGNAGAALELWTRGDNNDYTWDAETRDWEPTPDSPLGQAIAQAKQWQTPTT